MQCSADSADRCVLCEWAFRPQTVFKILVLGQSRFPIFYNIDGFFGAAQLEQFFNET